jgi:hypothetical protein
MPSVRQILHAAPALLLLAGCASNGVAPAPAVPGAAVLAASTAGRPARPGSDNSQQYVYGCTETDCVVFTADGQRVRTVHEPLVPQGVAADAQGNVYVGTVEGQILEYAAGMTSVLATLPYNAYDIAVHGDTLAWTDTQSLYVLRPGSGPQQLTDGDNEFGSGVAFDSHGNCYWSIQLTGGSGLSRIDEFAGCAGTPKPVHARGNPRSLAFDGADNLYYADDTPQADSGIYRCTGTTHCAIAFAKRRSAVSIRFDQGWQHLYADDVDGPTITRYDVATGKPDGVFRDHLFHGYSSPLGIAAGPGPG